MVKQFIQPQTFKTRIEHGMRAGGQDVQPVAACTQRAKHIGHMCFGWNMEGISFYSTSGHDADNLLNWQGQTHAVKQLRCSAVAKRRGGLDDVRCMRYVVLLEQVQHQRGVGGHGVDQRAVEIKEVSIHGMPPERVFRMNSLYIMRRKIARKHLINHMLFFAFAMPVWYNNKNCPVQWGVSGEENTCSTVRKSLAPEIA